ncbi:MAG: DUF1926 domain-containing protein [Treponema sp.]|nr:DUF1926 domain-containing protein [Treponema sp.]
MSLLYASFSLTSFSCTESDNLDSYYADVLKPLIKFLNKNPDFHFSFSFSGLEILYFKKKKNEFLKVLSELVKRGQCEIYGGAFYRPVLPLLLPSDRNGQIDLLTSEIRQYTGKAPRGICLYNDVWESSLIQTLHSCGMDYVLLNETIIPKEKRVFLPVQTSELGKSCTIFAMNDGLKEEFLHKDSENFLNSIEKITGPSLSNKSNSQNKCDSVLSSDVSRIINLSFSKEELKYILQNNLFELLLSYLKENETNFKLSTISEYIGLKTQKVQAFISSGICPVLKSVTEMPYKVCEKNDFFEKINYSFYDFMDSYPRSRALYNRMFYVSQLVNQTNKNKALQKLAKEKLWEGQTGDNLVCLYKNTKQRQFSYRKLMEAENIIRETSDTKESVISFDYNYDGLPEYVCRMENYFSYISLKGGSVQEFQSVKNTGNYADNFSREKEFDGVTDGYERGLFIDHLFTNEQFEKYINKEEAGSGIFSKVLYEELKFSSKHHELSLKAKAVYEGLPVSVTKKYIINSSGMNIQYILKNESDSELKGKFCVESNFAQVDFTSENNEPYKVLLATETEASEVNTEKSSVECFEKGYIPNINVVQITDDNNGISFSFEPNENCSYCFFPLKFLRPDFKSTEENFIPLSMTYVSTLFWDIDIQPGKEIEKNFNFTIFSPHKNRKKMSSKADNSK